MNKFPFLLCDTLYLLYGTINSVSATQEIDRKLLLWCTFWANHKCEASPCRETFHY